MIFYTCSIISTKLSNLVSTPPLFSISSIITLIDFKYEFLLQFEEILKRSERFTQTMQNNGLGFANYMKDLLNENTGVMQRNMKISNLIQRLIKERKTVGIRIPDRNIVRTIVENLGNPILTTSFRDMNTEVEYETDPELIEEKYGALVDLVIDGGIGNTEVSTVVDCTTPDFEIIRQGIAELK